MQHGGRAGGPADAESERIAGMQARMAAEHQRRIADGALIAEIAALARALEPAAGDGEAGGDEEGALAATLPAIEAALAEGNADAAVCAAALARLRRLVELRLARMRRAAHEARAALDARADAERRAQRAQELREAHVADEIGRCRDLLAAERARHGVAAPSAVGSGAEGLHEELRALFEAIARRDPLHGRGIGDPVLRELERLAASGDPADFERFPAWMRPHVTRMLEVIQERNRCRRLLKAHGLLPG